MDNRDPKKNTEGYSDPTAYQAIKKVSEEGKPEEDLRVSKLLYTIFNICELAGFRVVGRITIVSKKTGKIWW